MTRQRLAALLVAVTGCSRDALEAVFPDGQSDALDFSMSNDSDAAPSDLRSLPYPSDAGRGLEGGFDVDLFSPLDSLLRTDLEGTDLRSDDSGPPASDMAIAPPSMKFSSPIYQGGDGVAAT